MIAMQCIIFAGGKSSRMGENKALLPFGGYDTLLAYQYARMSQLFTQVSISVKSRDLIDFPCHIIEDGVDNATFAPTAGFVALFDALQHDRVFVLSVDAPFVSHNEIVALLEHDRSEYGATVARTPSGIHPMCGIYHRNLHETFKSMLQEGNHRLGKMLYASRTCFVDFESDEAFTNINHPHEYEAALRQMKKN